MIKLEVLLGLPWLATVLANPNPQGTNCPETCVAQLTQNTTGTQPAETMGCELVAVTNPPGSAVVEALDGGRFAVTTIAGADAVFDVVIVCGEASTRVPVVAIGEER